MQEVDRSLFKPRDYFKVNRKKKFVARRSFKKKPQETTTTTEVQVGEVKKEVGVVKTEKTE